VEPAITTCGSISSAPKGEDQQAQWLGYDTRHMLADLDPAPDQVMIAIGTAMGARDRTSGEPGVTFRRSNLLYRTAMPYNRGLDRDKDGVACEKK
jgi:hypothetical protein